ncbi:MAG: bifunctional folylpolyglutamate synthase/dihydrofolate synthase [Lachnospiraceae bacterium]|nr:bifunctional folylpolyglutamate synthase/dihydrofolate synthase [Lachnospiraceae bacterium]
MKEQEGFAYLEDLAKSGILPGLDRIREVLRRLGDPQKSLRFIHIAGTNGKGSVLSYAGSMLQAAGYRVGMYTSPAVFSYFERFRISGKPISKAAFFRELEIVKEQIEKMRGEDQKLPSAFEAETALALHWFAKERCDIVLMETGMGGREDATNVIPAPLACVITRIGMDHEKFLGNTPEKIAENKAGIFKAGSRAVTLLQTEEGEEGQGAVMQVLSDAADKAGIPLRVLQPEEITQVRYGLEKQSFRMAHYGKLEISKGGICQISNAALAVLAVEEACRSDAERRADAGMDADGSAGGKYMEKPLRVSPEAVRTGLKQASWPGRFEILSRKPLLIADGAHNPNGAAQLARTIRECLPGKRIVCIFGMLRDKDCEEVCRIMAPCGSLFFTVTPRLDPMTVPVSGQERTDTHPRALPALELAALMMRHNPHVTAADSVPEALEMARMMTAKEDVILAFGSLTFLGELSRTVRGK